MARWTSAAVVDELAQLVAGQRVVVAAGRDELELAGLVVAALGVAALEQEALDLVRDVATCRPWRTSGFSV
jgi:hypothetical protein